MFLVRVEDFFFTSTHFFPETLISLMWTKSKTKNSSHFSCLLMAPELWVIRDRVVEVLRNGTLRPEQYGASSFTSSMLHLTVLRLQPYLHYHYHTTLAAWLQELEATNSDPSSPSRPIQLDFLFFFYCHNVISCSLNTPSSSPPPLPSSVSPVFRAWNTHWSPGGFG